jgi:hypothetical protein
MRTVNASDFLKDFYMYLSIAENGEDFVIVKDGVEVVKVSATETEQINTEEKTLNKVKGFGDFVGIAHFENPEDAYFDEKKVIGDYLCEKYDRLG